MVIELLGIPGSGKTFLSSELECQLSKERKKCCNLIERSRNDFRYKVLFRLYKGYVRINPTYKNIKKTLCDCVKNYADMNAKYNTCKIDTYLNAIVLDTFLYRSYGKKRGLYVLDEGIAQQCANIITNFSVKPDVISSIFESLNFNPTVVYLECGVEISYSSIKERNRHVCYIDELDGEQLEEFLSSYKNACDQVGQRISKMTLNRNEDVSHNVNAIRNYLKV
ncbi:MAG: hypothetical protein LUD07_02635 [Clostridiales bacterium]|nr:hypothetical protein [Clostridiales bacterium]